MKFLQRRQFLTRMWQAGLGLVAAAGAWTSWDLLRPGEAKGFGGKVRALAPDAVPDDGSVIAVAAARSYVTRHEGEIVALSQKCTHLGCKVPFCDSSGQFECPCHGSVFNRVGEHRAGPAPRGMDGHPVEVGADGLLYIDTGVVLQGPSPGSESIDEPPRGPSCATEAH